MAQLKISDLSVGDWVEWMGERCKVDLPLLNTVFPHAKIYPAYTSATLQPIPITPEILKKNGLEYVDDDNDAVIFLCCDMFWVRLCVGDTFWQVGLHSEDRLDAVVCNIKHTHQLQHVLRLAGVEKEVEL